VMATANHYLADCLVGAAITATVYAVLNRPRIRRHLAGPI
jgi:hypothetical protein